MRALFTILTILVSSGCLFSQFHTSLLQFGNNLPQSNLINPAIAPDYKVVVGLPGVSSMYFDMNSPLSFRDLWVDDGTSYVFNEDGIMNNLSNTLRAEAVSDVQVFYAGFRVSSGFVSVSIRNRAENKVFVPSQLAKWAVAGPADSRVGNSLSLDDIGAIGLNYMEYGLSYTQPLTTGVQIGGRVKYLSGVFGMEGTQSGYVYLASDSASINVTNLSYQVTGFSNYDNPKFGNFFSFGNSGFGVDVGINAELGYDVQFSASVTDIGFISWKKDITKYESEDASYSFTGFDLADLFFDGSPDLQAELDTLVDKLEPRETVGTEFRTGLNPKINMSFTYRLAQMSSVGLTLHSAIDKGNISPLISVNHTLNVKKTFLLLTGLTYKSGKVNNISLGISARPGPVQFYFLTDRMNSFFYPARAQSLSLRMGMNITIGKPSLLSN